MKLLTDYELEKLEDVARGTYLKQLDIKIAKMLGYTAVYSDNVYTLRDPEGMPFDYDWETTEEKAWKLHTPDFTMYLDFSIELLSSLPVYCSTNLTRLKIDNRVKWDCLIVYDDHDTEERIVIHYISDDPAISICYAYLQYHQQG